MAHEERGRLLNDRPSNTGQPMFPPVIPDAPQHEVMRRRSGIKPPVAKSRVCGAPLRAAPRTGLYVDCGSLGGRSRITETESAEPGGHTRLRGRRAVAHGTDLTILRHL